MNYKNNLYFILVTLSLFLILTFRVNTFILFYFYFELRLIPIFLIIIGWGYQPERLKAGLLIFFYTLVASLPLLLIILYILIISNNMLIFSTIRLNFKFSIQRFTLYKIFIILAFLVKFPIYSVHLWLPKAHVEAPVSGSIILAGVLLKLGGYGLIRVWFLSGNRTLIYLFIRISLIGGRILGIMCILNRDIKVVIAYSSVVHISIIIVCLFLINMWCVEGGIRIILAHGICSSGLFAGANLLYERAHSRSYLLVGRRLAKLSSYSVIWFLLLVCNFGGPFSLNLLGEIILIVGISRISKIMLLTITFLSLFSAAYSIILYSTTQQGQCLTISQHTQILNCREMLIIIRHIWPLFLLPILAIIY